jgi:hypothetical protein
VTIVNLTKYRKPIGARRMSGRRKKIGLEAVCSKWFTVTSRGLLDYCPTLINEGSARPVS